MTHFLDVPLLILYNSNLSWLGKYPIECGVQYWTRRVTTWLYSVMSWMHGFGLTLITAGCVLSVSIWRSQLATEVFSLTVIISSVLMNIIKSIRKLQTGSPSFLSGPWDFVQGPHVLSSPVYHFLVHAKRHWCVHLSQVLRYRLILMTL